MNPSVDARIAHPLLTAPVLNVHGINSLVSDAELMTVLYECLRAKYVGHLMRMTNDSLLMIALLDPAYSGIHKMVMLLLLVTSSLSI